jgi:hypothetical protein
MRNFIPALLIAIVLPFSMIAFSGCSKKDTTCVAVIKVVRLNGVTVSGARVKLTSNFGLTTDNELASYLPVTKLTDPSGNAEFEFEFPAILDIEVTHNLGNSNDLIKLEPGKTIQKTITIQ